jgi:hypothetical protein
MMLVVMNLHGGSVNVRLESFEWIWKIRQCVRLRSLSQAHRSSHQASGFRDEAPARVTCGMQRKGI